MPARFGPLEDQDSTGVAEILARCFSFPVADALPWVARSGREKVRVLREAGAPVACLLTLPMGQFFGGRSVPTVGVAAVGVAPHLRGRGAAARIMSATLRELRAAGTPLSALYPATQVLYRKVGYEQAGARFEITIPAGALRLVHGPDEGKLDVRPAAEADRAAIFAAYRQAAARSPGYLDRGAYIWDRVMQPRGQTTFGYVVTSRGKVVGYTYFIQKQADQGRYALRLTDVCATTPGAMRRLLRLFADHRSMATTMTWFGGPADPCLSLLEEQSYTVKLDHHWMIRIVDVERALLARGYPAGVGGALQLDVRDDLLGQNTRRVVLEVADGRAAVRRGKKGERGGITLDVRTLAALYSGYQSAEALRATGRLDGGDRDVALASTIFAGPAPAMPDMF